MMNKDAQIENNREVLHWVNSAKGIGVILVILGHLLYDSTVPATNKIVYSFHMPLFFILSGYLQKNELKSGYIKKRVERLLIPFLVYAVISFPVSGLVELFSGSDFADVMMDSFYIRGAIYNSTLWFLAVLFEISAVIAVTRLPERSVWIQTGAFALFFALGWLVYAFSDRLYFLNLFGINRAIVCLSFYILGMLIKRVRIKSFITLLLSAISATALNLVFGVIVNIKVSIYPFSLGLYLPFYTAAVSGSIAVMIICKMIFDKKGFLGKIAGYSVLFLGTQFYWIAPFRKIMQKLRFPGTVKYDIIMLLLAAVYICAVPLIYDWIKKRFKYVKILNGELI